MKRKIALVSLCVVGLLVVFTLLAFSANAPQSTAASTSNTIDRPVQVDIRATTSDITMTNDASDAMDFSTVKSQSTGHHCDGEAAESTGY